MASLEPETLVLRAGSLGSDCTVLCVERVALSSLEREVPAVPSAFFASGGHRVGTPLGAGGLGDLLNPLPWDALRVANQFDSRLPEQRTSRKPSARHNGSGQMASLLYGDCEAGALTGKHTPAIGQHVIVPSGGTKDGLTTGLADLARMERRRMHGGAEWRLAFELPLNVADGASPRAVLQRFGMASNLLRDFASQASFRRGEMFSCRFAFVLGDVDPGKVERLLQAMQEACKDAVCDYYEADGAMPSDDDGDDEGDQPDFSASFLTSVTSG